MCCICGAFMIAARSTLSDWPWRWPARHRPASAAARTTAHAAVRPGASARRRPACTGLERAGGREARARLERRIRPRRARHRAQGAGTGSAARSDGFTSTASGSRSSKSTSWVRQQQAQLGVGAPAAAGERVHPRAEPGLRRGRIVQAPARRGFALADLHRVAVEAVHDAKPGLVGDVVAEEYRDAAGEGLPRT